MDECKPLNLGHGSDADEGHRSRAGAGANPSLTARISRCAASDYRLKEARQKIRALLTANHAWCIHHTMMAEDFKAAREAWRAADRDLGAHKVGRDGKFRWNCLKLLCHIPDFLPKIPRNIPKNAANFAQTFRDYGIA